MSPTVVVCSQHWTGPVEHESRATMGEGVAAARKEKERAVATASLEIILILVFGADAAEYLQEFVFLVRKAGESARAFIPFRLLYSPPSRWFYIPRYAPRRYRKP